MSSVGRRVVGTLCLALVLSLIGCQEKPNNPQTQAPAAPQAPVPPAPRAPTPGPSGPLISIGDGGAGGAVMASLSSANRVVFQQHMKNIGLAYKIAANLGQLPNKADDLGQDIRQQRKLIDDGTLVIYWGANPNQEGATNTVLGYVKDVPTKGGVVLMLDGSVNPNMTAAEFKTKPQAGK